MVVWAHAYGGQVILKNLCKQCIHTTLFSRLHNSFGLIAFILCCLKISAHHSEQVLNDKFSSGFKNRIRRGAAVCFGCAEYVQRALNLLPGHCWLLPELCESRVL